MVGCALRSAAMLALGLLSFVAACKDSAGGGVTASSCRNQRHDAQESDVDCGGACAPCAPGKSCRVASDCDSGVCQGGACAAPACDDKLRNGDETDTDCGGTCPACVAGALCAKASDCQSGMCGDGLCSESTCSNGFQDGDEQGLDCGGSCPACLPCSTDPDCPSGHCVDNVCVQCVADADCTDAIANPTGCNLNQCVSHGCVATVRHDGADFQGTPIFSPETQVSSSATTPFKVLWDGTNFLVVYGTPGGLLAKRVSPAGVVVDVSPIALDPLAADLAFAGGAYTVVTIEPGAFNGADAAYTYRMSPAGSTVVPKALAVADGGGSCPMDTVPNIGGARIASDGTNTFITSNVTCAFLVTGKFQSGAGWGLDPSVDRPRNPIPAGGAPGFAMVIEELKVGGGHNEMWGQTYSSAGSPLSGYVAIDAYMSPSPPVTGSMGIVAGKTGWLAVSQRSAGTLVYQPLTTGAAKTGTAVSLASSGIGTYEVPQMGFDGSNFLVVPASNVASLPGHRLTPAGAKLDAVALSLSPTDAALEAAPRLGSDGKGRYLLAYSKSTDGQVYVRAFSTCP